MRARKVKIEHNGKLRKFFKFAITEDGKRVVRIEPGIRNRSYVGRVLKQRVDGQGYFIVKIWSNKDKKTHRIRIHRIVARTFLGPCPKGKEVNHKDGIKLHNHYKNLEYVTRSENTQHAYDNGLHVSPMKGKHGREVGSAKLYDNQVLEIRKLWKTGRYTQAKLAEKYNLRSSGTIRSIVKGETWTHLL